MCNRDDFEAAYADTVAAEGMEWYLKEHRVSDWMYLFDSESLTCAVNGAWWGWLTAQQRGVAMIERGEQRVLH